MAVALEWQPEPDGVFEVSLVESVCLPPYVLLKGGGRYLRVESVSVSAACMRTAGVKICADLSAGTTSNITEPAFLITIGRKGD